MARKDACDFLTELGLNAEQCDLICDLLRKNAPFFLISEGLGSFDINVIIAERVKALFNIRWKSSFDEELGKRLKDPEFKKLFMEEMEKLRQGRK